jgi:quercetin dioxygenase-like cupin family protein
MSLIRNVIPAVVIACSVLAAPSAQAGAVVTPLMTKPLPEFPGKEVQMITVEYPPGSLDPIHRHDAHAFIYVLEGTIVMQVKGGKEVTVSAGQTFYEGPEDVHIVGRNASSTEPARFLVLFVKKEGAPILTVEKNVSL